MSTKKVGPIAAVFSICLIGAACGGGSSVEGGSGGTSGAAGKSGASGGKGGASAGSAGAVGHGGGLVAGAGGAAAGGAAGGGAAAGGAAAGGGAGGAAAGGAVGGGGAAGGAGAGGAGAGGAHAASGGAGAASGGAGGGAAQGQGGGSAAGAGGSVGGSAGGPAATGGVGGSSGALGGRGAAGAGGSGGSTGVSPNLIMNGNAETAVGSTDAAPVATPGWMISGGATALKYGVAGYPSSASPGAGGGGNNLFVGGRSDPSSSLIQTINLASYLAAIAGGTTTYKLDGLLGGFEGQEDSAVVTVSFRDGGNNEVAAGSIGPVTATDRGNITGLFARTKMGAVPSSAQTAVVTVLMTRTAGTANDGYADNLSLVLTTP